MAKEKANSAGDFVLAGMLATLAIGYFVWFLPASATRVSLLAELHDPVAFLAQWFGPAGTPLGLVDRVPVVAMAGLVLLAAYGIGSLVVAQCSPAVPAGQALPGDAARQGTSNRDDWTTLERTVFSLAGGLNLLATLLLLVGLAGLLAQMWLLWLIVLLSAGIGVWQVAREFSARQREWRDHWSRLWEHPALVWLAFVFAAVVLLGSFLPPWDFDVREYHLQVPKEWLQQGQITFLPHNVYGNMPLAAEMPALLAMSLWPGELGWFYGALAGKVVIAAFSIVTALALYAAGTRLVSPWCGIAAAAIYLSLPWVVHVSVNGLNDGVLAGYVFLAAYAMWLARRGAGSFLLPGLLAGGAAACKYPGVVIAALPLALWTMVPRSGPARPDRGPRAPREATATTDKRRVLLAVALFLAGVLIAGGAWYAKNAALAGNPVYPLGYGVFGGQTRTPEKHDQWQRAHQVPRTDAGWRYSPGQLAGSLLQVAGRDALASPLLVPMVLAAVVVLLMRHSLPPSPRFAFVALLWIFAVWWLVTHRIDRFLLPALPFAALLAACGASALRGAWSRWTVGSVLLVGFAYSLLANTSTLVGDNRWFVSLEQLRRDGPWPQHTPLRVKRSQQWLRENVRPGEAVLLVGDAAPFDLDMPVYYHTCFDDCLLSDWMQNKSADERRQELVRRNVAWVVVDWPEIARYQRPGNYGFDPRFTPELVAELVEQGILGPPVLPVPSAGGGVRAVEIYPVLPAPLARGAPGTISRP